MDKKENHNYDTVLSLSLSYIYYILSLSDKSENEAHEYSNLNDEHNWRNKNERGTRIKRTYLQPRPDFTGVSKRKKIDFAILQNGNFESLRITKRWKR